jgi:predicted nucleic acid-binding Zn ribbon protein
MERRKTENVSDVALQYLRDMGLEGPLNEYRLLQAWDDVMGPLVVKNTRQKSIYNQTLYVQITSSALKAELMMRRAEIIKSLNDAVGAIVIYDLVMR